MLIEKKVKENKDILPLTKVYKYIIIALLVVILALSSFLIYLIKEPQRVVGLDNNRLPVPFKIESKIK